MSDIANKILKNIEEKKITPKSKWIFLAKDYLVWTLFGLSTLIGSFAISVIIFISTENDWDIYAYLDKGFVDYLFLSLPYFWIVMLILLAGLAYFNYKHTKRGYLLNPYLMIFGSLVASVFLGTTFFASGMGEKIDQMLGKNISYYKDANAQKNIFWNNPEKGLLSGEIIEFRTVDNFSIKDSDQKQWEIVGDNIVWRKNVDKDLGENIKIIGKIKDEYIFEAQEIRPWGCGCAVCESDDNRESRKNIRNMNDNEEKKEIQKRNR